MPSFEMPEEFEEPRVALGTGVLERSEYFQSSQIGIVTDIAPAQIDPNPELAIVGNKGVVVLDETRSEKSSVRFDRRAQYIVRIDVEGDGVWEYLDRGGGWGDVRLFDASGRTIWSYGGMSGVNSIASGDMDGDGVLEFAVGYNGGGGVRLLDHASKQIWRKTGLNVWHIEVLDTDDDGSLDIVHSNAAGEMTVRNKDGTIMRKTSTATYFSDFSLVHWPDADSERQFLLHSEDYTNWVLNADGGVVAHFEAPLSESLGEARGTPVRLAADESSYFAVAVNFTTWERSVLYVYDPAQELVYQEIVPDNCAAIAAIDSEEGDRERLLLGGDGVVLEYALAAPK